MLRKIRKSTMAYGKKQSSFLCLCKWRAIENTEVEEWRTFNRLNSNQIEACCVQWIHLKDAVSHYFSLFWQLNCDDEFECNTVFSETTVSCHMIRCMWLTTHLHQTAFYTYYFILINVGICLLIICYTVYYKNNLYQWNRFHLFVLQRYLSIVIYVCVAYICQQAINTGRISWMPIARWLIASRDASSFYTMFDQRSISMINHFIPM